MTIKTTMMKMANGLLPHWCPTADYQCACYTLEMETEAKRKEKAREQKDQGWETLREGIM